MSDTTMYTKGLNDGWFLVASAADNVSIKSNSDGFWHVAVADTLPAAGFVGEKHSGVGVKQITGLSGKVYLRAVSTHSFAVTVGTLQQGVTYGLDDSGALVAQGMDGDAAKVVPTYPSNLYAAGRAIATNTANSAQMLWNPSATKDLVIESCSLQGNVDGEIYVYRGTAVLATEITGSDIGALDSNAPATIAELYHASDDGIPIGERLFQSYTENTEIRQLEEVIGMVLHQGEGCCLYYLGAGGRLRSAFKYSERDV